MDTAQIIAYLQFFNDNIFTAENVTKAKLLGKSLADIIAEIYSFAYETALHGSNARSLEHAQKLHEAGLEETFYAIVQGVKKSDLPF